MKAFFDSFCWLSVLFHISFQFIKVYCLTFYHILLIINLIPTPSPAMNLHEVVSRLSTKSRENATLQGKECDVVHKSPTKFYQMECASHHYYTTKFAGQLPLREIEGFCRVQMRSTTSKHKMGRPILMSANVRKPGYNRNICRSIQQQPRQREQVRSELLARRDHVVRLPKGTSLTSHGGSTVTSSLAAVDGWEE